MKIIQHTENQTIYTFSSTEFSINIYTGKVIVDYQVGRRLFLLFETPYIFHCSEEECLCHNILDRPAITGEMILYGISKFLVEEKLITFQTLMMNNEEAFKQIKNYSSVIVSKTLIPPLLGLISLSEDEKESLTLSIGEYLESPQIVIDFFTDVINVLLSKIHKKENKKPKGILPVLEIE